MFAPIMPQIMLADLRSLTARPVSQGAENVGGELPAMVKDQGRIFAMISMIVCHQ